MVAKDSSGNYQLIAVRDAGESEAGINALPSLVVKDLSGNLQYINARDEGDAVSGVDALPAMCFKDSSGNFVYPQLNAAGELPVTQEALGTSKSGSATVTPSVVGTEEKILSVALTASKNYSELDFMVSCMFATKWRIAYVDDVGVTDVEVDLVKGILTGPGQYSFAKLMADIEWTQPSTGSQELQIHATQLHGPASDQHATASCNEAP
jgi:hypothetical protein